MNRSALLGGLIVGVALCSAMLGAQAIRSEPPAGSRTEQLGIAIPMRDGVRLAADVFLPQTTGRWPTVLFRTPYGRKRPSSRGYREFVKRGYAVVIEDVRGRYASQGVFSNLAQEGPDGDDTINWIAEQPWSNARVAMAGGSYLGMVQWWAAIQDNPHLFAISPLFSGDDEYLDRYYSPGGALQLGHRLLWLAENMTPPSHVRPLFSSYIHHLPLRTADVAATGVELPAWQTALDHPSYDEFWKQRSLRGDAEKVRVPVLSFGGWFDTYVDSDLDMFARLAAAHREVETWIGPWGHNPSTAFGTRDFGRQERLAIRSMQADWFDQWGAKRLRAQEPTRAALHIFVMGPDIWREEHEWPLARARDTPYYLASDGHANSSEGDGQLNRQPTMKGPHDVFTYDPRTPVPTEGGAICCEPGILPPGPLEQTAVERRNDVLVYTSTPLKEDTEVTGPVRAVLYVSTSANDTDFTAKLVDVGTDGSAIEVCDGIQRLRYRLSLAKPVFVKRNTAYQISVDVGVTSYQFAAGHKIRLEVSSSNFPRFDRNMNSSGPNSEASKPVRAKQTVYHEKVYPSALILPVVAKHAA